MRTMIVMILLTLWTALARAGVLVQTGVLDGISPTVNTAPLYPEGRPMWTDVRQGWGVGDCYYLGPLLGLAYEQPDTIEQLITQVDETHYRVSFPGLYGGTDVLVDSTAYAQQSQGAKWVQVLENAYALVRTGNNTFASLNTGNGFQTFWTFGLPMDNDYRPASNQADFIAVLDEVLGRRQVPVFGTPSGSQFFVSDHEYFISGYAIGADGVAWLDCKQPWGAEWEIWVAYPDFAKEIPAVDWGGFVIDSVPEPGTLALLLPALLLFRRKRT